MSTVFLKAAALWFLLAAIAIANGTLREQVLVPRLGETVSLPLSGITLSGGILLVTWLTLPWYGRLRTGHYLSIGFLWLLMTSLFELGFGHVVAQKSWSELLAAYDFASGNLWVLVLATTLAAPWLSARIRGII